MDIVRLFPGIFFGPGKWLRFRREVFRALRGKEAASRDREQQGALPRPRTKFLSLCSGLAL